MVATSKDGFVWAKAVIAVSARQIASFLSVSCIWFSVTETASLVAVLVACCTCASGGEDPWISISAGTGLHRRRPVSLDRRPHGRITASINKLSLPGADAPGCPIIVSG